jgi:RecA/RadA recombinase
LGYTSTDKSKVDAMWGWYGGIPATAIADLALTVSNPPTQAEVQAVANKVDALLALLRSVGILANALFAYLRSDGVSGIFRPDGSSVYRRP